MAEMTMNSNEVLKMAVKMIPKHYELEVRVLAADEDIYNLLEDVTYHSKAGEIVLRGTCGEEWIIPQKKLKKYIHMDGRELIYEDIPSSYIRIQTAPSKDVTWMAQVPTYITGSVTTERGDELKFNREGVDHGTGDWICFCDDNGTPTLDWGMWVVNGNVIKKTYAPA